jgi:hypothetical protein
VKDDYEGDEDDHGSRRALNDANDRPRPPLHLLVDVADAAED